MSNQDIVAVDATAVNEFSDSLSALEGRILAISIVDLGSFAGTVSVQRRFNPDDDTDWRNWKNYTTAVEDHIVVDVSCEVRIGSTALTAGSVKGEIRQSRARF